MLTCLIIEDDFPAQRLLKRYVSDSHRLRLLGTYETAHSACEATLSLRPALLLLDIALPGASGFDLLRQLPESYRPKVIFTTDQDPLAQQVFDYNVVDFLKKPFSKERFLQAVAKIPFLNQPLDPFFIKDGHHQHRIIPEDILYIEGFDIYVKIHLHQGYYITVFRTLKSFETQFPVTHFLRVHRSHIINLSAIHTLTKKEVSLVSKSGILIKIPIGDTYQTVLQGWVKAHYTPIALTDLP